MKNFSSICKRNQISLLAYQSGSESLTTKKDIIYFHSLIDILSTENIERENKNLIFEDNKSQKFVEILKILELDSLYGYSYF